MNKRFFMSIFAYFAISMVLAVGWHLVLFHEKYQAMGAFTRGEPIMPFGMFAIIMQGAIFGYFYPMYLAKVGENSFKNAIQYSLLMGINVWTVMVFATAAKFKIEPVSHFVVLGTVFQLLQFVGVGVGLKLVFNKKAA